MLKQFRQSVLAAAVAGQLTEAWRRENADLVHSAHDAKTNAEEDVPEIERWLVSLPKSWRIRRASEAVAADAEIVYGIVQPGPKLAEGVPYVRGMDIVDGRIQVHQLLRTSPAIAKKYARAALKGGDVLLGIIRATKVAIVPAELEGANITQGTARFRPSNSLSTRYLAIVLEAPATQRWLHAHYRGIDMPGLNLADVRRTPIPVPPEDEQAEIVRRVDSLLAIADGLETKLKSAQSAMDRLTPAILAKAFRGDLVPQDPSDESAAALLKRLKAQRSGESKASKGARTKRAQSVAGR
ncbi:restriction endonuclease subunit S [Burkholderia sp. SRS-W-2-2016]|uniref:restriction endonuclease subunit S n=1 Tax=Burkholderia sp. SRS-W-2-2016 TaxID=1926878 RepID=UPI0021171A0F|nr:restriction endonuclease subunit S [Burkholderia sp. SRS-W-2-2016]